MLKKILISAVVAMVMVSLTSLSYGFWLWTPKTGKLINPKWAIKDTPEEQYDWAMSFYNAGDFKRAAEEFLKVVQAFKNAKIASEAQYYGALSFQKAGKYYGAFQNYQKVIKHYPFSPRIEEIIKTEYDLGLMIYNRSTGKLMGTELMIDFEKAVEIFQAVVDNMPYGPIADNAQYMIGMCNKKIGQYTDAANAFDKLAREYPKSDLVDQARYEMTQCLYMASGKSGYDQEATDTALDQLKRFSDEAADKKLKEEADSTIVELRARKAQGLYDTALFYEKRGHYDSAKMYYGEVAGDYSDTKYGKMAQDKMARIEIKTSGAKK